MIAYRWGGPVGIRSRAAGLILLQIRPAKEHHHDSDVILHGEQAGKKENKL
jgi:hypothetical protein